MSGNELFLAIDGFSKMCKAQLVNEKGDVLGEARSSSVSLRIGASAALIAVESVAKKVLTSAGLSFDVLSDLRVGLGLPGANIQHLRNDFLNRRLPFKHFSLLSDFQIACLGAHGGDEGAILILDTLSAGLVYREDVFFSVGGWDFPISCFGGGAHMGMSLLQSALLAHEGVAPATELTRQIMDSFDNDAEQLSHWSKRAIPNEFARYAPVVFEAAEAGDPVGCEILRDTMNMIENLCSTLVTMGADRLSLAGDLVPFVLPYLSSTARERLVEPLGDSMLGALILAGFPQAQIPHYLESNAEQKPNMSIAAQAIEGAQQLSQNNIAFAPLGSAEPPVSENVDSLDEARVDSSDEAPTDEPNKPADEVMASANDRDSEILNVNEVGLTVCDDDTTTDHDSGMIANGGIRIEEVSVADSEFSQNHQTPWYAQMIVRG